MSVSLPLPARDAAAPRRADAPSLVAAAVDLHAVLLSQTRTEPAAAAWVRALAARGGFDRATLALLDRDELKLLALSDAAPADLPPMAADALRAALAEALDQSASLLWPEPRTGALPRILLAQQRLLGGRPGAVASVPLVAGGQAIGALGVERATHPISAAELDSLEHLACLAAPVLHLMQLNQRSPWLRLQDTWHAWRSAPERVGQRWAVAAVGGLLALGLLWPLNWHIGGHARLEGAVQRVLVAPADGFLRQVHARPGQTVKAGQLLVELADQDLLLEQQRWQSQLAQYDNATAAANARADRTQQVIQQSRAAEAEAQLELVQVKLARGRIEAPFDGLVIQGDLTQSLGAPLAQGAELMTVAPMDRFRVIVEVDERDIAAIAPGQTGTLALSARPWGTLPLRVTRLSPMATAVDGRNVFEVEAELLARDADLRPGLQGTAQLLAGQRPLLLNWGRRLVDGLRLAWWGWWG